MEPEILVRAAAAAVHFKTKRSLKRTNILLCAQEICRNCVSALYMAVSSMMNIPSSSGSGTYFQTCITSRSAISSVSLPVS